VRSGWLWLWPCGVDGCWIEGVKKRQDTLTHSKSNNCQSGGIATVRGGLHSKLKVSSDSRAENTPRISNVKWL
jgi:hypothetical protein